MTCESWFTQKTFLESLSTPISTSRILDAGSGKGETLKFWYDQGARNAFGIEMNPEKARNATEHSQCTVFNKDLRFFDDRPESWDGVYCSQLFDELTPSECQRILVIFFKILKRSAPLWLDWIPAKSTVHEVRSTIHCYPYSEIYSLLLQSGFTPIKEGQNRFSERIGILSRKI